MPGSAIERPEAGAPMKTPRCSPVSTNLAAIRSSCSITSSSRSAGARGSRGGECAEDHAVEHPRGGLVERCGCVAVQQDRLVSTGSDSSRGLRRSKLPRRPSRASRFLLILASTIRDVVDGDTVGVVVVQLTIQNDHPGAWLLIAVPGAEAASSYLRWSGQRLKHWKTRPSCARNAWRRVNGLARQKNVRRHRLRGGRARGARHAGGMQSRSADEFGHGVGAIRGGRTKAAEDHRRQRTGRRCNFRRPRTST